VKICVYLEGAKSSRFNSQEWISSGVAVFAGAAFVLAVLFLSETPAFAGAEALGSAARASPVTNSFPSINEVLQGRVFENKFERDVFFLRAVRERYPADWPSLVGANIIISDYVQAPDKLARFVEELGTAMAASDDVVAVTNLASVISDPAFYANPDAYRPEILRATALALIRIGPHGRKELANSFNDNHYRTDATSLEVLADAIGESAVSDSKLIEALAATAFSLTATNGGYYPRCSRTVARNLLRLPQGNSAIGTHLTAKQIFNDPGRFQPVLDAIGEARATQLTTNLVEIAHEVAAKLEVLKASPGAYRDDLLELQVRVKKTIDDLSKNNRL
jgi:hypothetical protein